MITMINYPSESPKEFYGGSTSEGKFYFPDRYNLEERKRSASHELVTSGHLRKTSEGLWNDLFLQKMIEKLNEPSDTESTTSQETISDSKPSKKKVRSRSQPHFSLHNLTHIFRESRKNSTPTQAKS